MVEFITGMDTRIGYPNEHLAGNSDPKIASPLYATSVGLLMQAIELKTTDVEEPEEEEESKKANTKKIKLWTSISKGIEKFITEVEE